MVNSSHLDRLGIHSADWPAWIQVETDLPAPPPIALRPIKIESEAAPGYLSIRRSVLRVEGDRREWPEICYDELWRKSMDAAVVLPYFRAPATNELFIILRSAQRPPVELRAAPGVITFDEEYRGLWEIPAGLIEESELTLEGSRRAAARELAEEAGLFFVDSELERLGHSTFPCPGAIAERQFFYAVELKFARRLQESDSGCQQKELVTKNFSASEPSLDGSVLEALGRVIAVPFEAALTAADKGLLPDAKTELALRRFQGHRFAVSKESDGC
ncbi:MAG: NUDIX domain-containing protein [Polyangiaceae bacterium]|nr:NUDIX domain-containing protein [Polyangiaceae bacterium]